MKYEPTVSVIVPTHNRNGILRRTLDAICFQTCPLQQVKVVVVADGCTDGTMEMLRCYTAPFALHSVEQPGVGAASARNYGASLAAGHLLLFLDDDIESTPSLIEAHVRTHRRSPGHAVIGACPPVFEEQANFLGMNLRQWWEDQFRAMGQPGHRYTYRDLLTGNLSIEARLFARVGGFDPALQCREDYEFGMRLIKADIPLTFAADSVGYHHETPDLDRSFQRVRQEGRADVRISRHHPELRPTLPLAHFEAPTLPLNRILRELAFRRPAAGDALAARVRCALGPLEWMRLRGRWRRIYDQLRDYWYWRGVAEELRTRQALADFLQGGPGHTYGDVHEIELDLREGLETAERRLDEEQPAGARIRYGQQPVGHIPPVPGAERLRGIHLRPVLATQLATSLLTALAVEAACR